MAYGITNFEDDRHACIPPEEGSMMTAWVDNTDILWFSIWNFMGCWDDPPPKCPFLIALRRQDAPQFLEDIGNTILRALNERICFLETIGSVKEEIGVEDLREWW